jgi:tetratricopeptide (TPR) repeat protein
MSHFIARCRLPLIALSALLVGLLAAPLVAADPQKEILDGLKAKGDYAAAADYLQKVRTNPGLPSSFAETIDYELAVVHIEAARRPPDGERDAHYRLAQEALKSFLADHAKHALAPAAQSLLGNMLMERGRMQRSLGGERAGEERAKFMKSARDYLAQSDAVWTAADSAAEAELKKIVFKRGEDIKRSELREELHRQQIQARLARAWVQYERALTYDTAAGERMAALNDAASRFEAIDQQQRERLAGFYAQLGRGLCMKEQGEPGKAFALFEEMFGQLPDDPADFRVLRGRAAVQALEIALRPDVKKYKQGLDIAQRWIAKSDGATPIEFDLAIRFLGAEAATGYMKSLPPPSPEQNGIRQRQRDWIAQQYTAVAAATGPYQAQAKTRLLDPALGGTAVAESGTFADARNRAKAALDRLLAAESEQKAAERSGIGNDADSQRQRRQQIAAAREEALKYCQQALDVAKPSDSGEPLDAIHYYQAFVRYDAGKLEEAAADGEAIVQSPSDSPAARQAARIGLAAREALFHTAQGDARAKTLGPLKSLAEEIIQRWGSYAEADDARAVLCELALAARQPDKADDFLRHISDTSSRRGEAELEVGRALWGRAQQLLRTSTLDHDRTADAEKLIVRAAELLSDGIARCRKAADAGAATPASLPAAILAMAEIEMLHGRAAEAITLLEDRDAAPAGDSFGLTLLAYIAAGDLEKARSCLQAQQAALPPQGNAECGRQTVKACIRFQRLVKQHLARYRDRRLDDVLKQTVEQLDHFLAAPAEGPVAESCFILAFRAEGYAGLAAGLDRAGLGGSGVAVVPDAQQRYRRAIATFQEVLHRAASDRNFAPAPEVVAALRIDLARCLRRMFDYPQALSQLLAVLKDHPQMVDAQVEAAYTYQSWGEERPEYLEMAIHGGNRYQEVWGWGELARRVQPEPRFREVFCEARYNLAQCRFRQAQAMTERTERSRLIAAAKDDIFATRRVCQDWAAQDNAIQDSAIQDMGGPVWYDRYNELFQRIQRLANEPAVGLPKP